MDQLVVGEDELGLNKVVNEIEKAPSFVTIIRNWEEFGNRIGLSDVILLELEGRVKRADLQLRRIPREIIKTWKADKGNDATLKVLYDALVNCGVAEIAETLKKQFATPASVKMFLWKGKRVALRDIVGEEVSEERCAEICKNVDFTSTSPIKMIKDQLLPPKLPNYYVQRTLFHPYMTELDITIFLSEKFKTHVFLFKGARKSDVAKVTGFQPIEHSGDQLDTVTARFILLDCEGDFEKICRKTTETVHVIIFKGKRFFWATSNQSHGKCLKRVRRFLKGAGNLINEQDFVDDVLSMSPPCAFPIVDSPGMGKTLVLANFANNIQQEPKDILLFIVLQEFAQTLEEVSSLTSAIEALAAYSSCNQASKSIFLEILQNENFHELILFLDGYDEVMKEKKDVIEVFLNYIREYPKVKLIVTARPHLQEHLEALFNRPAYEMQPFNEINQIEFLTSYWIHQYGAEKGEQLEKFAKLCLNALQTNLIDEEEEIAGIPLQCMILAEVFAEDAMKVSTQGFIPEGVIKPISFFQMYKRLVQLKFDKITCPNLQQRCKDAHVLQAIKLLFPDWDEIFKLTWDDEIDENTTYSIGLMETSPNENTPRFIHRTFAEYLLAEFIVNNLDRHETCVLFFFGEILGPDAITFLWHCHLKYSVTAYFIEMHLREYVSDCSLQMLPIPEVLLFNETNVCKAVKACCYNNFEHTFDYAIRVLRNFGKTEKCMYDDFTDLPEIVVKNSSSVTLLKKTMKLTKNPNLNSLLELAVVEGRYNMVAHLLPLCGDQVKKMSNLLSNCVRDSFDNKKYVLEDKLAIIDMLLEINHEWLEEEDTDGEIPLLKQNVNLCLLKRLVEHGADINATKEDYEDILSTSYEEKTYVDLLRWAFSSGYQVNSIHCCGLMPILYALKEMRMTDVKVLKIFQEAGADLNAQDAKGNSVLFYALRRTVKEVVLKMLEYGAELNHKNKIGQNALHRVMVGLYRVEDKLDILDMLVNFNPDWIHERDKNNCTPLLQNAIVLQILKRLVHHGADINACSTKFGTVLDTSHRGHGDTNYVELVRWALASGFNEVNHQDEYGLTPIMRGIRYFGDFEDEVFTLFHQAGADFNAADNQGNSVIFYALTHSNKTTIAKILDYGGDINHKNQLRQNALHKILIGKQSIEDKLELIDVLDQINRGWIEERDTTNCTPILQKNVDLSLIKRLEEHRANTNAYSSVYGSVLHTSSESKSFEKGLLPMVLSYGLKANQIDPQKRTPIMRRIQELGTVTEDELRIYHEAGADFNAQDGEGNSVLFYALKHLNNVECIGKLLEYGADINHRNKAKENALHQIVQGRCSIENKLEIIDMLLAVDHGFLEEKNTYGATPMLKSRKDIRVLQRLLHHGGDINTCDYNYKTIINAHFYHGKSKEYADRVRFALANGFNINSRNGGGGTPVMRGITEIGNADSELWGLLHDANVDFNAQDTSGNSVLFLALRDSDNHAFIKKLLQWGADVNHRNAKKQNALHMVLQRFCIYEDRLKIIDMLVGINTNWLNERDEEGNTPLLNCMTDFCLLERLVEYGSDINVYSRSHGTVLHNVYRDDHSYAEYVTWAFFNGFKLINHTNKYGETPFMFAIRQYATITNDVMKMLKGKGADFNAHDLAGDSIIFYAVKYSKDTNFIKKLVEHGAKLNHKNCKNQTVAHKIMKGSLDSKHILDLFMYFETKGFHQFNHRDIYGRTPLDYAAKYGKILDTELVTWLRTLRRRLDCVLS